MSGLLRMFRPKPKPKPKTAKELQDELRMLEKKKMDLQSEKNMYTNVDSNYWDGGEDYDTNLKNIDIKIKKAKEQLENKTDEAALDQRALAAAADAAAAEASESMDAKKKRDVSNKLHQEVIYAMPRRGGSKKKRKHHTRKHKKSNRKSNRKSKHHKKSHKGGNKKSNRKTHKRTKHHKKRGHKSRRRR